MNTFALRCAKNCWCVVGKTFKIWTYLQKRFLAQNTVFQTTYVLPLLSVQLYLSKTEIKFLLYYATFCRMNTPRLSFWPNKEILSFSYWKKIKIVSLSNTRTFNTLKGLSCWKCTLAWFLWHTLLSKCLWNSVHLLLLRPCSLLKKTGSLIRKVEKKEFGQAARSRNGLMSDPSTS